LWQHQVEYDRIVIALLGFPQPRAPIAGQIDGEAFLLQCLAQGSAKLAFVLDHQNTHGLFCSQQDGSGMDGVQTPSSTAMQTIVIGFRVPENHSASCSGLGLPAGFGLPAGLGWLSCSGLPAGLPFP
jgi:hypothetical protein